MDALERTLQRRARGALALALLLVLAALPAPAPRARPCLAPVTAEARRGRTTAVRCDGPPGPALAGPVRLLFGGGLDPNTADAEALTVLPGVGNVRAEQIVRARQDRRFERVEDLLQVPGIGPVTLAGLRPWLELPEGDLSTTPVDRAPRQK